MKYMLALLCLLSGSTVCVAAESPRHGFWGVVDVGFGSLRRTPEVDDAKTETDFYLGLAGGYTVHPQLQLGIEASGWNIKSGNIWDPTDGEGISAVLVVARYWPTTDARVFFKAGAGRITHWSNAGGSLEGSGSGYAVGLGYELFRYGGMETHWFLSYSAGSIDDYTPSGSVKQDEDYSAITTGLSLGF